MDNLTSSKIDLGRAKLIAQLSKLLIIRAREDGDDLLLLESIRLFNQIIEALESVDEKEK